ncbi:lipopolysaccharide-induced tumor necrosis factor-alpha factor homolog isoform X1 [Ischnura elegans]|uniref:lipopolysaccharide-induced tumor necrosis factor-alpha factor homolog isoform X1 n=1 Tax=Ischnura elegans TaxID=197161 RepID=UPI001ED889D3|nr:lipopolysaccharide-induced tumor necrosis factor-alpha factor homolog isoform X1 [Ischnura elegans]
MSTGGYNPTPPPNYNDSQTQQYGFKPPAYNPDMPPPVPAPEQPPAAVTVIHTIAPQNYGPEAQHLTCPSCRATVTTKVLHENSTKTHIICLIMCVVGLWPCCLIPYCVDSCKNANHYCPSCNAYLGTYKG